MALLPPPPAQIVSAIYAAYEADRRDDRRPHLGASRIGEDCERALWLDFRWASRATHTGRMLRLFETGELEEKRLVANLRRIGVTVLEFDPDTGKQWRLEALGGHFGGSMDAVVHGLPESPKAWHVCEFKTHNAKSFRGLEKGVQHSKPSHWYQMQIYMHLAGIDRALYLAKNKDTDEIYQERVKRDEAAALRLIEKARRIIFAARPPQRISEDPTSYLCRFCSHHDLCHGREKLPELSCRTCIHSTPLEDGRWLCERWNFNPDTNEQKAGCPHYLHHPDLVPGEQIDAGLDWIEYRMNDGTVWRDGFAAKEVLASQVTRAWGDKTYGRVR
jgi:hypothetical protein